ncbi:inositol hexakisphosphate kinase 2-like [Gouania willdenowi]|uniref:Kinase n=1 Tax=Gouania willdenowi TaxID=441366 RepID=A0A8C5EBR3_GOUWI|nr:inositol hexakisphosphate kinase 2-like [Gouania willdenowi]
MSPAVEAHAQGPMNTEKKQRHMQQNQNQQQCCTKKGVMLEPFVHQVGGHSCVLRFGEQTICKPLVPREHQFYKTLPAAMRKFTPQFRGVVSVSFEEDEDGNLSLIASPLHGDPASDQENKDSSAESSEPKSKMLKWGKMMASSLLAESEVYSKDGQSQPRNASVHKIQEDLDLEFQQQADVHYCRMENSKADPQIKHNPWSFKCHQKHLQRMKENAKHRNQYKFILLENLTWQHVVPCVLDLKVGTRQHGDDASEEKKAMQIRKCAQSTSALIGVRVCGMQTYQPDTGQLIFMNKYHGRKLTLSGFKEALYQFFHSGRRLRRELLSPVLSQLREMQTALESCDSYRFYSSSLLIIYDAAPHRKSKEGEGEDVEGQPCMEEEEVEVDVAGAPSHDSAKVDVRVIDFAHATSRHFREDSVVHEGQDSGFIFGVQNLITSISELENHGTE